MDTDKILNVLNKEQIQAVTSVDGAYRLIAGAGSGKTFTLTRRVAYICNNKGISPDRILCLTFTNKAAAEMSERLSKLMNISVDDIYMSTYHHFAYDILKRNYKEVFGWNSLSICQASASVLVPEWINKNQSLFKDTSEEERKLLKSYIFNKVQKALNSDYYVEWLDKSYGKVPLASAKDVISYMVKETESKKAFESYKRAVKTYGGQQDKIDKIKQASIKMNNSRIQYKEGEITPIGTWVRAIVQSKNGMVTFDDIIKCALYMLRTKPEILEYWQNRFDYIQGDEFQDTDFKQLDIIRLLYKKHGNLFVVGDPDQSIYLFRGAEPSVLTNLGEYIPHLKTIFMRKNYRSTDEIVGISNKVIELNKNRVKKNCVSQCGNGSNVKIINEVSDEAVAEKELHIIEDLISNGVEPKDIAILYSNKNDGITAQLQKLIALKNIQFTTTLVEDTAYKDATFALCKYQHTGRKQFVFEAASYLDDETKTIDISNLVNADLTVDSLFEAFNRIAESYKKDGKATAAYQRFLDNKHNITTQISDMLSYWNSLTEIQRDEACKEDSLELLGGVQPPSGDGLSIMTMHRSKGLEFKHVFVNGISNDVFTSNRDSGAVCEEKARLAYVAYSRAKEALYIGVNTDDENNGVLGQILNENYLDFTDKNTRDGLIAESDKMIGSFHMAVDNKIKPLYRKLMYNGNCLGYRCEYYLHGEKTGYHANIKDLDRLNCIPKEKILLIELGDDINVLKIQDNHFYAYDELSNIIKVIDLEHDNEILQVFGKVNTPYELASPAKENIGELYNKYKNDAESRKITQENIDEKPSKQEVKTKPAVANKSSNIKIIKVVDKNSKKTLGVRAVNNNNPNQTKDIKLEDIAKFNITLDMCSETIEIETKQYKKYSYDMVYNFNQNLKEICEHFRIIDINFKFNQCIILQVSNSKKETLSIDKLLSAMLNKQCYITNLSKLRGWNRLY